MLTNLTTVLGNSLLSRRKPTLLMMLNHLVFRNDAYKYNNILSLILVCRDTQLWMQTATKIATKLLFYPIIVDIYTNLLAFLNVI